jgi:hypothetical protein
MNGVHQLALVLWGWGGLALKDYAKLDFGKEVMNL